MRPTLKHRKEIVLNNLTAYLQFDRNEARNANPNLPIPTSLSPSNENGLLGEFVELLLSNVVEIRGTGTLGLIYEPAVGISIDMREYDISKLEPAKRARIEEQILILEDLPVGTMEGDTFPAMIKIELNVF